MPPGDRGHLGRRPPLGGIGEMMEAQVTTMKAEVETIVRIAQANRATAP